jgi:hypothetical protein
MLTRHLANKNRKNSTKTAGRKKITTLDDSVTNQLEASLDSLSLLTQNIQKAIAHTITMN